jgi:predicted exporter
VLVLHRETLWDPQISTLNPITMKDKVADAELRAALGASDARRMIAVHGASADEALATAEKVGVSLDRLVASGAIAGYESPARYLPSLATQQARPREPARRGGAAPAHRARGRRNGPEARAPRAVRGRRGERARRGAAQARAARRHRLRAGPRRHAVPRCRRRWTAMVGLRRPADGAIDVKRSADALAASGVSNAIRST